MNDSLHRAAQTKGSTIPHGVNFNSRTLGDGNYALHAAAQYGNHGFITQARAQLQHGYHYNDLFEQNFNGEIPLHIAAEFGHLKTVKVLLNAHLIAARGLDLGLYLGRRDHQGDTPLHKALKHGHEKIAILLLRSGVRDNLVWFVNGAGESLAYLAAENSCTEFLLEILEGYAPNAENPNAVADPNAAADPIAVADQNAADPIAADQHVADPIAADPNVGDPNAAADQNVADPNAEDPNVVSMRLLGYGRQTVFHSAARRLTNDAMHELIERIETTHLNNSDEFGKTALHYAVEENKSMMVKELLTADSSLVYLRDNGGLTPLDVAFKEGLYTMVDVILKMSPQAVEIRDGHGRTPLHYAKMDGVFLKKCQTTIDKRMLHLLINRVDNDGNTALHVALLTSRPDAAYQLLHFSGCNCRIRNNEGHTPLDLCNAPDNNIPYTSQVFVALRKDWSPYKFASHSSSMFLEDENKLLDKIAIAAALLLPLNFAAAFSIPGGYDNNTGVPILRKQHTFHVYSIANMIAFLATVLILIGCTFGIGRRVNKKQLAKLNIFLLQVALFTTVIAYVGGIFAIGDIGRDYKARLPIILLSLGVGIVSSLMVINWYS